MAPKKEAKGGLSAEDEAKKKAEAIDDIDSEDYKKSVRIEIRQMRKFISDEEKLTGQLMDERLRINYFWLISKKELEDKQAELRNKERELQDLQEKHQIEIKIYKQRCKHLIFQNLDQLTELKKEAQITLKNIEDENRINERELKQDLRSLKVSKKEQEVRHQEYLNALTRDKNKQQTKLRQDFERISNEIHLKYKNKMTNLRLEME
jgi:growth arrest-specific protein 8